MIAERLHSVVQVLIQDFNNLDLLVTFTRLETLLSTSVSSPSIANAHDKGRYQA